MLIWMADLFGLCCFDFHFAIKLKGLAADVMSPKYATVPRRKPGQGFTVADSWAARPGKGRFIPHLSDQRRVSQLRGHLSPSPDAGPRSGIAGRRGRDRRQAGRLLVPGIDGPDHFVHPPGEFRGSAVDLNNIGVTLGAIIGKSARRCCPTK